MQRADGAAIPCLPFLYNGFSHAPTVRGLLINFFYCKSKFLVFALQFFKLTGREWNRHAGSCIQVLESGKSTDAFFDFGIRFIEYIKQII